MDVGSNTVLGVVVNEPGTNKPLQNSIVEDGLDKTIEENAQSEISSLTLGVVNVPTVSQEQRDDAVNISLTGFQASSVRHFVNEKT